MKTSTKGKRVNELALRAMVNMDAMIQLRQEVSPLMQSTAALFLKQHGVPYTEAVSPAAIDDLLETCFTEALMAYWRTGVDKGRSFSTYLVNKIRWALMTYLRDNQYRVTQLQLPINEVVVSDRLADTDREVEFNILLEDFKRHLRSSNGSLVSVFEKLMLDGHTVKETARVLSLSIAQVRWAKRRIQQIAREYFNAYTS